MVTKKQYYWEKLGFFGGNLFLDFLNTFDDLGKSRTLDTIPDWDSLLRWAEYASMINSIEVDKLKSDYSTKEAKHELEELHRLRDVGWEVCRQIAANAQAKAKDVSYLTQQIQWAYSQATLSQHEQAFSWSVTAASAKSINLSTIRVRLLLIANGLLSSSSLINIGECGACTGLFLNKGRGVGRKWCRMKTCGNRAKIQKFRASK